MDGSQLVDPTIIKQEKKMEQLGQSIKVVVLSWIGSNATLNVQKLCVFHMGKSTTSLTDLVLVLVFSAFFSSPSIGLDNTTMLDAPLFF